ncbi:MAG: hypothetical protein EXR83_00305 [Gammaproteobacteria bacterium]|nr:hypothetical protein [Gammaproteobacteria bacterium]
MDPCAAQAGSRRPALGGHCALRPAPAPTAASTRPTAARVGRPHLAGPRPARAHPSPAPAAA